ncbi:MAG: NAD(P)-dependent oxidoreductase [Fervidicoccaceae archaeon]|uniref:NAD(P)-dependent oxidoreductase n=1 Tax=Fervidicoccus fontis TaxID=683846 RepID=A0A7C2YJE6_9CREN|nr:NAD(P)-dependent oxidoreductase [Fervidicoccus fontis]
MKIGIIGFGNLGSAIAQKLLEEGHEIFGWNRTPEKVSKIKGARVLSSPWEVVRSSDVTFTILSDDEAVEEVLLKDKEKLSELPEGSIIANISTITPYMSMRLERELGKAKLRYAESPVLGGPQAALSKNLISLLGGKKEIADFIASIMRGVSREVFYIGEVPKASALKLVFNSGTFTAVELIGEMLSLASSWNIDAEIVKNVASKTVLSQIFSTYLDRGLDPNFPPYFYLELAAKDLSYAIYSGRKGGSFTPAIAGAYEAYISAVKSGLGKRYYGAIIRYLLGK